MKINPEAPHGVHTFTLPGPGLFRNAVWTAEFSARGLRRLAVHSPPLEKGGQGGSAHEPSNAALAHSSRSHPRLAELKALLRERLAGRDATMAFDEFDLDGAPEFHLRIWKAMHRIPFGEVATYGELAMEAGSPLASRACGQACGSNRIILLIPCHRVVSASGLGGFGCGLQWKKALLELEGYTLQSDFSHAKTSTSSVESPQRR